MLLPAVVFLVCLLRTTGGENDNQQGTPFSSVKKILGVREKNIPRHETMLLIRNMLYRVRCDQANVNCQECLGVDSVLNYLNRSREGTLDEASFKMLSIVLVVFMKDVENECSQSEVSIGRKQLQLSELFQKMTNDRPKLRTSTLVDTLRLINQKYRFGSLVLNSEGVIVPEQSEVIDFSTDFQCFSPTSLYNAINKPEGSELNSSEIQMLAVYIVLNVLEGHCISIDDKPSAYSFLADLFSALGDKAKDVLDHEEFENLLEALNLDQNASPTTKAKRALQEDRRNRSDARGEQLSANAQFWPDALGNCLQRNRYPTAESLRILIKNVSEILNETKLLDVCPKVIDTLSSVLWRKEGETNYKSATLTEAYGYGSLATAVISISPLGGIVFLKISCSRVKGYVLSFLMALAVATLTGDAILHLLLQVNPQSDDLSTSDTVEKTAPNTGVVGMVMLGDIVHNFVDGLALGAAFTAGVSSGLSTSIAIFCHELPHELGDFSALISAGLTVKRALLLTFASGIAAFVGLGIGVPLAGNTGGKQWVFAFTAGIFLYVSLANVIPELMKQVQTGSSSRWMTLVLINMGMLFGYGVMFAIAMFEEKIVV